MSLKKYILPVYKRHFQFLVPNKLLWIESGTRKRTKVNWGMITQTDITEKFLKLTEGLDAQSADTVIRILSRQKAIITSNKLFLSPFTTDEKREIREQKENFDDQFLRVSENLYAYKNYLLPIDYHEASVLYHKQGTKELETIDRVKGKVIIDAGGYIGDSVLIFEELKPKKIYTFEPSPDNFELMKRTIEINGLKNVVAENMALGAEKSECPLYVHDGNGGSTGIIKKRFIPYRRVIKVPVTTLDDYVEEHKIENIGLIKADIEGAEAMLLAGAKKTISEQKPILLICIYHNAHDFFEIKPLIESWNLGYKFKIYKPNIGSVANETLLIAEIV